MSLQVQSRYIPNNSRPITREGLDAVVYITEVNGVPYGVGYSAKRGRSDFNHRFRSLIERDNFIAGFFDRIAASAKYRAERKAAQAAERAKGHGLKIGDMLYSSWGYEQTNVDFYEVIEVRTAQMIVVREVAHAEVSASSNKTYGDRGSCVPVPGKYTGEARTLRWSGRSFKVDRQSATKWDGQPKYWSAYA